MTDTDIPSDAQTQQDWRKRWDAECPMTIAVTYAGWERGSDAALREELRRIRDTGFNAVRVHFDRDNDIEKMAGMVNWRNPDRFFDAAEKAALKVIAAPGNQPRRSAAEAQSVDPYVFTPLTNAELSGVATWLQKFCGQYRAHSALLAWVLHEEPSAHTNGSEHNAAARQENTLRLLEAFHAADPGHPVLTTTLYPLENGWGNRASQRAAVSDIFGGSFTLHRDFLEYSGTNQIEIDRPAYVTARIITDRTPAVSIPALASCTTGTSRLIGDYAVTMNAEIMTRMLLLFLAGGLKIICFDRWKASQAGAEAGEDAMLDWLARVTPYAQVAGHIAQAATRYAQELWRSASLPQVHVLYSVTNDLQANRFDDEREKHSAYWENSVSAVARMGAARVLLDANIPFSFLSEEQFVSGTVTPAPILFLPHTETLSEPLLAKLKEYAANGGRVVADMPTGYLNEKGELLDTRPGSPFEQLFGASIAGLFCFSSPAMKDAEPRRGQQRANIVVTTARAGGGSGETPAFTENRVGKGRAVLVNASLSRLNAAPGLQNAQLSLLSYLLGSRQTVLSGLTGCLTFRRTLEQAEHVFLVNDSAEERGVNIAVPAQYTQAHDALDADLPPLAIENNSVRVTVEAGSGRWLRLAK